MPKHGVQGQCSSVVCIHTYLMVYKAILPFQKTSLDSVSVMKDKLDPELDHLRVIYKLLLLLVYAEAWSLGTIS